MPTADDFINLSLIYFQFPFISFSINLIFLCDFVSEGMHEERLIFWQYSSI